MAYLARIAAILLLLTIVGILGFRIVEGWSLVDCAYMTVITLTTVGYGEVQPLSTTGKVFVTIYLGIGIGAFVFCMAELGKLLVEGVVRDWLETRRMENIKSSLEDHFIVCGFGRMGQIVCEQLEAMNMPFVVIEVDEAAGRECRDRKWPVIHGDCTEDRVLLSAGVDKARGVVATLGSDSDNLYVVLTVRHLSSDSKRLLIVARTSDENGEAKLLRAGADQVVNLYHSTATKMARWLVNPNVQEFMELVTTKDAGLDLAEIQITADSPYAGARLQDTDLRDRGLIIVAIRRADGELLTTPGAAVDIREGDSLIALGDKERILNLITADRAT